jgi:hypothetical protein
MMSSDK